MTDKPLSTTREALMAELLIDVDRLLERVSDLDRSLGETIEKSTKDAANKGFLAASLQIKKLTEELEFKIQEAMLKVQKYQTPSSITDKSLKVPNSRLDSTLHFLMGFLGAVVGVCALELLGCIGR